MRHRSDAVCCSALVQTPIVRTNVWDVQMTNDITWNIDILSYCITMCRNIENGLWVEQPCKLANERELEINVEQFFTVNKAKNYLRGRRAACRTFQRNMIPRANILFNESVNHFRHRVWSSQEIRALKHKSPLKKVADKFTAQFQFPSCLNTASCVWYEALINSLVVSPNIINS